MAANDGAKIKERIASGLKNLVFDGAPVIQRVFDRAEIYHGPLVDRGPDIILLANPGFDLKGKVYSPTVFGRSVLQGMHTQKDAFLYSDKKKTADNICEIKRIIIDEF